MKTNQRKGREKEGAARETSVKKNAIKMKRTCNKETSEHQGKRIRRNELEVDREEEQSVINKMNRKERQEAIVVKDEGK